MDSLSQKPLKIGLCLSGGGSRSVAFHLGCMRALNQKGLLPDIRVLSSVSGGSVVAAFYAYTPGNFDKFEAKVLAFLKRGLARDSILDWFATGKVLINVMNLVLVLFGHSLDLLISKIWRDKATRNFLLVRRPFSRSSSVRQVLEKRWFPNIPLSKPAKEIEVIINACELQTTTAFRFGSHGVRCWPYGDVSEKIPLADAVSASAAYPGILPAIDRTYSFTKNSRTESRRVILTDGGVYENLGITPLLPNRDPKYSLKASDCDVIIACDAGSGIPRGWGHHQWIVPRLINCFSSVMRRTQAGSFATLHEYKNAGRIKVFILSYLGQEDSKIPNPPADLVPHEAVADYPTDFNAMTDENIALLSKRGEQLTSHLISLYWPQS